MKMLRNMTLKAELYLVFGMILIILISLGVGGIYTINQIQLKNQESISEWKNINFISETESKHLEWVNKLNRTIMMNADFDGELDYSKTDFGKFYYNLINSEKFNNMSSVQKEILISIEEPYQNLHNSAAKIIDILQEEGFSTEARALKVFKNETLTNLNQVQNLFANYKDNLQKQTSGNTKQVIRDINNIKNYIIITIGIIFISTLLFVYFFTKRINSSLSKTIKLADNIAKGNLKVDNLDLKRNDEISYLADSLNEMKNSIKNMILNINNIASNLTTSSEELSTSGQQVAVSAQQVGQSIEQVASGAEEQSAQAQEANNKINELSSQINEVQKNSNKMNLQADQAMGNIAEGNDNIDKSITKIEGVKDNSIEVAKNINNLGELSNQIGNIVELINNIAEQTNLLALNAAIEAARAGEAGRGFSVVADEIRQLAEESSSATGQISELIKKIQSSVSDAVAKMNSTERVVDDSVEVVAETNKTFMKIKSATVELKDLIKDITLETDKISQNSKDVELTIEEVASVSEEAASNSEEVAAASEQQNTFTTEIVKGSKELSQMALNLKEAVNKFNL